VVVWESLVLFERNYISSYFDKLPEANTVGVRDIIPLLQVLHGIRLWDVAIYIYMQRQTFAKHVW
jgi:hypothetical protein